MGTNGKAKKNIGVLLPVDLWKDFRKYCLDADEKPGEVLADIIDDFLKEQNSREVWSE